MAGCKPTTPGRNRSQPNFSDSSQNDRFRPTPTPVTTTTAQHPVCNHQYFQSKRTQIGGSDACATALPSQFTFHHEGATSPLARSLMGGGGLRNPSGFSRIAKKKMAALWHTLSAIIYASSPEILSPGHLESVHQVMSSDP